MENDILNLYFEVRKRKKYVECFESIEFDKKLRQKKLINLQFCSRRYFIRFFSFFSSFPLSQQLANENILDAFSPVPVAFLEILNDNEFFQKLKNGIIDIYEKPTEFAKATVSFLDKNRNKIPIFANIIVPSIFGFFLSEEQIANAFDFLNEVFNIAGYNFAKPFLLSFLAASFVFIDIFWENFYKNIQGDFKPSLAQLNVILLKTLNESVSYLSSLHIQLLINVLCQNPRDFCDLFFDSFLLRTFEPFHFNSRITFQNMSMLFHYIQSKNMNEINECFSTQVFTNYELLSFGNTETILVLSPIEASILYHVLIEFNPDKYNESDLTSNPNLDFNIYNPGCFEMNELASTSTNKLTETANKQVKIDNKIIFNQIFIESERLQFDPLLLFNKNKKNNPKDTRTLRIFKKKYKIYLDKSGKLEFLQYYNQILIEKERAIQDLLLQKNISHQLDDLAYRIKNQAIRFDPQFCTKFDPTNPKVEYYYLLYSLKLNDADPKYTNAIKKYKNIFSKIFLDYSLFNKQSRINNDISTISLTYSSFYSQIEKYLDDLKKIILYMDQMEFGSKLLAIDNVLQSLAIICQQFPEYIFPTCLRLFDKSSCDRLFEILLVLTQVETSDKEKFSKIANRIRIFIEFYKFICSYIANIKNIDLFSEEEETIFDELQQIFLSTLQ